MTRVASSTNEDTKATGGFEGIRAVPAEACTRGRIRRESDRLATALDRRRPLKRSQLEKLARSLLHRLELNPAFLGFTMVAINNAFWRDQFAAVPPERRVILLPHCLRNAELCRGAYDEVGLTCAMCGSCLLKGLVEESVALGYTVVIAEGTPAVVQIVLSGAADAILGVACLDSLEKAFKPVADLGIPNLAVPLLKDGCADTVAEPDAITEFLYLSGELRRQHTRSFLPLLRMAKALFDDESLAELLGDCMGAVRNSSATAKADATGTAESLALEWLRAGGKRFRPFITLAGYSALARGAQMPGLDADLNNHFPPAVKRVALAIEVLHKASLIHDDIEDDDAYRYGRETLHRRYDTATAINVGDYLIGLGYGLVAAARETLGAECVADILSHLTEAHLSLCRGQAAEIALTGPDSLHVQTAEIQRIYALKTAPAFEAALYIGIRAATTAGDSLPVETPMLRRYCRFVGVAYQLLNDLKDWAPDDGNKLVCGQDLLAARPTMLRALLNEALDEEGVRRLDKLDTADLPMDEKIKHMRRLYESTSVFHKAEALVQRYRERACALADGLEPPALAELLQFIVEVVL